VSAAMVTSIAVGSTLGARDPARPRRGGMVRRRVWWRL